MPKLTDIVKLFSETVSNEALASAMSATNPMEVEFSDDDIDKIKEQVGSLMTFDKAVNSSRVIETIKPSIEQDLKKKFKSDSLFTVEKQLEEIGGILKIDLNKDKQHQEQLKLLKDKVGTLELNGDTSKFEQEIATLHGQLKEKDELIQTKEQEFNSNLESYKIDSHLRNHLSNYKLQDAYSKDRIKNSLFNDLISDVKSKATLKLGADGNVGVYQKEDPTLELYGEGNKKLGVSDLIDPEIKPYLRVSDPATPTPTPAPEGAKQPDLSGSGMGTMQAIKQQGVNLA